MSLIEETLFGTVDKVANSIAALRHFEPEEGYYFANSGGKVSTVVRDLLIRSGVKFDAHYHITTVDPPELVHFIRDNHPETVMERPRESMWQLIVKKFIPPTRHSRYCCAFLKENGGHGRLVATGVRKSESKKRSTRQLAEQCYGDNSKRFLNPIIEWDENDVWTYIKVRGLVYCNIYDEVDEHGRKLFKRLGCVMCPLSDHQKQEAERWPKIADQYRRTCDKAYARLIEAKGASTWKNGTDMVNWWISGKAAPKEFKDQVRMTDEGGVLFFER